MLAERGIRAEEEAKEKRETGLVDLSEFDATLDALAEGSEKIPDVPEDTFTRAGIYRNHD